MKFLLVGINAKYIHSNPAIYSLRAYAGEAYQSYIELAEYTINNRQEEILSDIYSRKPDVIGFSCYIWNFTMVKDLLADIPKVLPGTKIWLGGPEVSFDGERLLREYPMIEGIMIGEGEATFLEVLQYYVMQKEPAALQEIKGLCLRTGRTPEREALSMDVLPFLYESLDSFENRIIYYESSRGCPFRCSYCLSAIDKSVRFRSLDTVKEELRFFLNQKAAQVKFIDRTFNCNHEHAYSIWKFISENDNGITNFHFEIAADIITEEEIALLSAMRPGLVQLEIGVQSTNEKTLKEINRFVSTAHIAEVVAKLKKADNIHIHLDLIAGLPQEDYDSFAKSFNEVYAMKPHQLQLGFLKVLKGAPIEGKKDVYGLRYQQNPPYEVLCSGQLSYEEIQRLKRIEEMIEIYYNSNQFFYTLQVLTRAFDGAFEMYEALADYYREQGYFVKAPARSSRYDILLDFAAKRCPDKKELYRELLTFDFYLREKPKSRPAFAGTQEAYREQIWRFYCSEEENPRFLQSYGEYHARQMMKMTHLEGFWYPVWEAQNKEPERMEMPAFVLFDYQIRNPLNADGQYLVVSSVGNE